jgi:hypothetical protein
MFSAVMDTTDVFAEKDGSLTIKASGNVTQWLPDGRDRFVEKETGTPLAVTRRPDGRVERIASPLLYPVAEFERAPGFVSWVEDITKFSLVTLFLAVLAAPISWAIRKRRRKVPAAAPSEFARAVRSLARVSFWMIIGTLLAWGVFAIIIAMNMSFFFTAPVPVRIFLGVMSLLSAPFAAMILVDAVLAWRDPARGWLNRFGSLAVAVAAVGMAWLFYVFDVTNFSTNW